MGQSLIDQTEIFIDGIHIKAAANNHKYTHKVPDKQAKFMSGNWELRLTWIGKNTAWALKKNEAESKNRSQVEVTLRNDHYFSISIRMISNVEV